MARTPKTGLNYFPFDVDFFDDPKVCAVIVEHGVKGQAAIVMLLCAIYRHGYFLEWTPECCVMLLRNLPGVTISKMGKIIKTLVEWEFFDRQLFEEHQVLTNRDIQQRFLIAARRRKFATSDALPYWLVEEDSKATAETAVADPTGDTDRNDLMSEEMAAEMSEEEMTAEITDLSVELTGENMSAEMRKMSAETTTKEIEKNIDKNINIYSSPTTTHTREAINQIKGNQSWTEAVCMRHHLTQEELADKLEEFALDCECRGKPEHDSISDVQGHFCNWLLIHQREASKQQQKAICIQDNNLTPQHHAKPNLQFTSADYVREAQQWAIERTMAFLRTAKDGSQAVSEELPF